MKKIIRKVKSIFIQLKLLFSILLIIMIIVLYYYFKDDKIIVLILAGRKKYLEILMIYLKYLKYHKKISEIHFWQFTKDKSDEDYLNSISNLHKTNGNYPYYRDIYPIIHNNNYFVIKINLQKNGACLLINNKFEITFNLFNNTDINLSLNISNRIYFGKQNIIYNKNYFYTYIIKILNNQIIIEGEENLLIKSIVEDNNFTSIKIKSQVDGITIWDYKERFNKDIKLYDTLFRKRGHWYEMYKFYLDYDFNILLKMDDDISFIDIDRFKEYINFIKSTKKNITIPNLVNHAVSLYYNNKEKLVPNSLIKNIYQKRKSSLDVYYYFKDGNEAQKIHQYFFENINKFTKNNINPVQLNGQKPSICMFGITKESYNYVYNPKYIYKNSVIPKGYEFDDEVYTYRLRNNYLYPRFVCIHYAFGPQRDNGLKENFLDNYKKLAKKYAIES